MTATTTYTLCAYDGSGAQIGSPAQITVTVTDIPAVTSFSCIPNQVHAGQPVTLTWQTVHADHCTLVPPPPAGEPLSANVDANQPCVVNPTQTTTYQLSAVTKAGLSGGMPTQRPVIVVGLSSVSLTVDPVEVLWTTEYLSPLDVLTVTWSAANCYDCTVSWVAKQGEPAGWPASPLSTAPSGTTTLPIPFTVGTFTISVTAFGNDDGQPHTESIDVTVTFGKLQEGKPPWPVKLA